MFASCVEKITNHKFFSTKLQPKIDSQVATNNQQELLLRAININQGFLLQKLEQFVFLVLFFSATPHTTIFLAHTNFMLQADNIIRCKQAQQNNCRLAHSRLLALFVFAMHMGIMLQPDSIIRCKKAQQNNCRLAHTADYYPFLFFNAHENHVATRGHPTFKQARQFVPAAIY
jgi:hypothetical protein